MTKARTSFTELPVVDVSGLYGDEAARARAAAELDRAAREVGFLYVTGHRIPRRIIDGLLDAAGEFFALPRDVKDAYYIGKSTNHRGYVPRGEERFYGYADDLKEAFDTGIDLPADDPDYLAGNLHLGPNVWPTEVPGFSARVTAYYQAALDLGRTLFRGFAIGLGLPEDTFLRHVNKPTSQLRLVHYWPNPGAGSTRDDDGGPMGIGAHTDYECFTILLPTAPGLQVLNSAGNWIEAPPVDGAFVINIGDMLETWTNGAYKATTHRVRKVPEERFSFPLFFATDYETIIEPLPQFVTPEKPAAYPALCAGDHLVAQTMQTFRYLITGLEEGRVRLPDGSLGVNQFGHKERKAAAG